MEFAISTSQGYVFIISFMLTVGLFYLILFYGFQRKTSYIFFSLLCLFHIFKIVFRPDQDFIIIDPAWMEMIQDYRHIPFSLGGISLIGFLVYEFNMEHKLRVIGLFILTISIFYIFYIPSFGLMVFSGLAIAIYSLKKDRQGGIYAIVGLILFGLFTRLEIAQQLGIAYYLGVIIFIITMTLLVGQRIKMTLKIQREAQLKSISLENQLLKSTIQPHFITNSLTSLQELIDTAPAKANLFIENLAEEFRLFSEMADQKLIPIKQELSLCSTHLEIMNQRLQSDIKLEYSDIAGSEMVPPGIFHTLVENGLTHGFRNKKTGTFKLNKNASESTIEYNFSNNGDVTDEDTISQYGTGFRYIQNRLSENFGNNWTLHTDTSKGLFNVAITVPQ